CKHEFEAFLARESAIGRNDLVFPILYMTVAGLENEAHWRNDPLLQMIGRRQYIDWRTFRHRRMDDTEVREAIERFSSKIVEALNVPVAEPPSPDRSIKSETPQPTVSVPQPLLQEKVTDRRDASAPDLLDDLGRPAASQVAERPPD